MFANPANSTKCAHAPRFGVYFNLPGFMLFSVTQREKTILAVIAALIVLGLIGMAVL